MKNTSVTFLLAALALFPLDLAPFAARGQKENSQAEIADHVERATTATERRDFQQAEAEWNEVLALNPNSPQALNNLSMVYYLEHKYPDAGEAAEKALKFDPSLGNARALLGASLVRQRQWERGIEELNRALTSRLSEPAERTTRLELYEALSAQGSYARALEVLGPLATKFPRDPDVLYKVGQAYLQLAAHAFAKIPEVAPDSARLHQILADSSARQGHYREAIEQYRLALEKRPDLAGVHYQIGALYRVCDQSPSGEEAAIREFRDELKIDPYDAWSEYRLGVIYSKRSDTTEADSHLRRSVQLDSSLVPTRLAFAALLEKQGKQAEAEKELAIAEKLEPTNAITHYRLARIYKQRGDAAAAESELKKFEECKTQPSWRQHELARSLTGLIESEPGLDENGRGSQ